MVRILLVPLLLILLLFSVLPAWGEESETESSALQFVYLQEKLIQDGFDPVVVLNLYNSSEVQFLPKIVYKYITYKEGALNYSQFLKAPYVLGARKYLADHQKTLGAAYSLYGVSPRIIVALLTVESSLGRSTGNVNVFNCLSSLALAGPAFSDFGVESGLTEEEMKRLERRSKWAYTELKAFLKYTASSSLDPHSIKGSIAGAFGIPQFMPSSCLSYACDGDGDGKVNLFSHDDAIMSVARYLKLSGWRKDLSSGGKKNVILNYNRSTYYADTIVKLSEKITRETEKHPSGKLKLSKRSRNKNRGLS